MFEIAPPTLDSAKIAPLHEKLANRSSSTKHRDLRARFTKMVDLLKGCSTKLELVKLGKLPTICYRLYTLPPMYRFVLFTFLPSFPLDATEKRRTARPPALPGRVATSTARASYPTPDGDAFSPTSNQWCSFPHPRTPALLPPPLTAARSLVTGRAMP